MADDFIRRADIQNRLDEENCDIIDDYAEKVGYSVTKIQGWIDSIPAVDVVPVVRCKDCKYFELERWKMIDGTLTIIAHEVCAFWSGGCKTSSDGYCSEGIKKEVVQ